LLILRKTPSIVDEAWKKHLRKMELKQSVQLAVQQKDPLLIYKFEAFNLFNGMLNGVNKEVISSYSKEICKSAPDIEDSRSTRKGRL
jgi:preprotein translocase subunit SecA